MKPHMKPDVSVCIPTYGQPALAVRVVRSALAQQGCDLEVVVTDDTRGPDVEAALAPFRADPRFRYLRNETQLGAVRNWNHALEMAEGRVRKLLHHDDWFVDETSLIQLVAPILEGRARVAFTACNALNAKEEFEYFHGAAPEKIAALRAHHNAILFENFIGPPSVCATDASLPTRFDPRFMWTSDMDFYNRAVRDAAAPSPTTRRRCSTSARIFRSRSRAASSARRSSAMSSSRTCLKPPISTRTRRRAPAPISTRPRGRCRGGIWRGPPAAHWPEGGQGSPPGSCTTPGARRGGKADAPKQVVVQRGAAVKPTRPSRSSPKQFVSR